MKRLDCFVATLLATTAKCQQPLVKAVQNQHILNSQEEIRFLTLREIECLRYLLIGETAKQIARRLSISPRTVEHHCVNIKSKLGCNKKSDLQMLFVAA